MKTIWGERLDKGKILGEYPRPQMERGSYLNLNGAWDCAFTKDESFPSEYEYEILVPFSPESELSGVGQALSPDEWLWYRRKLTLPAGFNRGRVLLHFGAADQTATVYINGVQACFHTGGYTAFSCDITEHLKKTGNEIIVKIKDITDSSYHSRGKQKTKSGGIWYTPQSGLWQTVWCESVPKEYISSLAVTPLFDESAVRVVARSDADLPVEASAAGVKVKGRTNQPLTLRVKGLEEWTPETPNLYDLRVTAGMDSLKSYFGMRKFEVRADEKGVRRFFLNGRPYFCNAVLDQGYWSDGLLTAPDDEALIYDIKLMKSLGFNTLRKHIKIEPQRWYYHCDRLGMLVWQDMINGGGRYSPAVVNAPLFAGSFLKDDRYKLFSRDDERGREQYCAELSEMLSQLQNAVSLAVWVPFNEGWGQFDALKICDFIRERDDTRPVDHASGWHDQGGGDFLSKHVYFAPYKFKADRRSRAVALSEFGGYSMYVKGHSFADREFGYKKFSDSASLRDAFIKLYEDEIIPAKEKGLSAAVYTQLSDVESEVNGFVTYDRKKIKLTPADIKSVVSKLNDK